MVSPSAKNFTEYRYDGAVKPPGPLLAASLLAPVLSFAQTPARRDTAVIADLGLHVIGVGYQRTVSPALSAQVDMEFYAPWTANQNVLNLGPSDWNGDTDVAGVGPRIRLFVHPFADAPSGLWVSPFTQAMLVRATRGSVAQYGAAIAAGLSVGYALQVTRWLLLSVGVGGQYHVVSFNGSTATPGFSRFSPTVDINVGYTF